MSWYKLDNHMDGYIAIVVGALLVSCTWMASVEDHKHYNSMACMTMEKERKLFVAYSGSADVPCNSS